MPVSVNATLGDLVVEDPRRSRIFENLGIDYCCNGQRSLAQAASEAGLDPAEVAASLALADPPAPASWQHLENAALAHDIVDTHHAYLWEEMPRLRALVDKVHGVHGARHPELARVQAAYAAVIADLEPHLTTEERSVFPAISRLEKATGEVTFSFGSLEEALTALIREHDAVGDLFKEMRELTAGYVPPDDACGSYVAMLDGLLTMERDLHEHIHKENNILFPKVLELLRQRSAVHA